MKHSIYIAFDCPITPGGEEVEVYFDIGNNRLFFYCYGCGSTWLDNPVNDNRVFSLEEVVSREIRLPTTTELEEANLSSAQLVKNEICEEISIRLHCN